MAMEGEDYAEVFRMVDIDDDSNSLGDPADGFSQSNDFDDDSEFLIRPSDTTSAQARHGKDIQGIAWNTFRYSREEYREKRVVEYRNFQSLDLTREELEKNCKEVEKGGNFYEFQFNTRLVKPSILHFQLRNLVWATSNHDVYLKDYRSIMNWSAMTKKATTVLNLDNPVPDCKPGLKGVQISTMCVRDNLLVAGGFHGEMVCKNIDKPGVLYCAKITEDRNPITNAIEIFDSVSGATRIMSSNNDSTVRVFDSNNFAVLNVFHFSWEVNHTSVSPDSKMVVVVGDQTDGLLADCQSGKIIATLKGHLDYSFASAWHPGGYVFATGNQDTTCRLWDVRQMSSAVAVLKGRMGAIRSIRFTSDGSYLAMAEPADFVHIFDTKGGYNLCQEIDLFGEIAGISLSPDTEALYIGVSDRLFGSLLEFNRVHDTSYVHCMI